MADDLALAMSGGDGQAIIIYPAVKDYFPAKVSPGAASQPVAYAINRFNADIQALNGTNPDDWNKGTVTKLSGDLDAVKAACGSNWD